MRYRIPATVAILVLAFMTTVQAAAARDDTALWASARAAMQASKNLVADELATDMEMIDDSGQSMGKMHLVEKLTGWNRSEPVRTIVANDNKEYEHVANIRFKISVDNHPDQAVAVQSRVLSVESATLDERPCALFHLTGKHGPAKVSSLVWVEESSGRPLKVIHEFVGFPMTKSLTETIRFGPRQDGMWLPESVVVDSTVGILFQRLRIVSKYQFHSWLARPAAYSSAPGS